MERDSQNFQDGILTDDYLVPKFLKEHHNEMALRHTELAEPSPPSRLEQMVERGAEWLSDHRGTVVKLGKLGLESAAAGVAVAVLVPKRHKYRAA